MLAFPYAARWPDPKKSPEYLHTILLNATSSSQTSSGSHNNRLTEHPSGLPAVLLGPLRALDYFFSHGLLAVVLGSIWHLKSHWSISLAVGAVTRLVGLLGYFYITAWILKEDLLSLMLSNVYALLVHLITAHKCTDSMHTAWS